MHVHLRYTCTHIHTHHTPHSLTHSLFPREPEPEGRRATRKGSDALETVGSSGDLREKIAASRRQHDPDLPPPPQLPGPPASAGGGGGGKRRREPEVEALPPAEETQGGGRAPRQLDSSSRGGRNAGGAGAQGDAGAKATPRRTTRK